MTITKESVAVKVRVMSVRWFEQWNRWKRVREYKACVTMAPVEGGVPMVTFTASRFAETVKEGGEYEIECKHKDYRRYRDEEQELVTHCRVT